MERVIVITGASSGIGFATAKRFLENGGKVYNLSRSSANIDNVKNVFCDVTDEQSVEKAFAEIAQKEGKIDVLVLNAGYGISGAIESTPVEKAISQFDVNFFGQVRCVKYAAPLLRKAGSKKTKIVMISSLAAVLPIPFQGFYSASKAAICNLARCLNSEMRPFGIKVCSILPGDTKTGFTDKRQKVDESASYAAVAAKAVGEMEKDERKGMSAEKVAKLIVKVSGKNRPKTNYTAGFSYKLIMLMAKIMPAKIVDFIIRKKYF